MIIQSCTMIQVRMVSSPGSSFTGSVSSISNSRHKDITVLQSLVGTTSWKQKSTSVFYTLKSTTFLSVSGVTHPAVFAQHSEGRRQQPVEELQQQGAVVLALQNIRKAAQPGDHQGLPAQLRRFHVDHATSTDCCRLQWTKIAKQHHIEHWGK